MKNARNFYLSFAIVTIAFLSGCIDEPENPGQSSLKTLEADQQTIADYLTENEIIAEQDSIFGLYYVNTKEGTGASPNDSDRVNVDYSGTLLGSTDVFDSGDSIQFPLNGLIGGWRILMPYMKEGGEMKMYIPRGYAYNEDILVFDVTLNDVVGK